MTFFIANYRPIYSPGQQRATMLRSSLSREIVVISNSFMFSQIKVNPTLLMAFRILPKTEKFRSKTLTQSKKRTKLHFFLNITKFLSNNLFENYILQAKLTENTISIPASGIGRSRVLHLFLLLRVVAAGIVVWGRSLAIKSNNLA